jgi:hypothetical protein
MRPALYMDNKEQRRKKNPIFRESAYYGKFHVSINTCFYYFYVIIAHKISWKMWRTKMKMAKYVCIYMCVLPNGGAGRNFFRGGQGSKKNEIMAMFTAWKQQHHQGRCFYDRFRMGNDRYLNYIFSDVMCWYGNIEENMASFSQVHVSSLRKRRTKECRFFSLFAS